MVFKKYGKHRKPFQTQYIFPHPLMKIRLILLVMTILVLVSPI